MYIKIVIADDQRLFREGLNAILRDDSEIVIVGEASTGEEAVVLACELRPDIILMDLDMPDMNGITATYIVKNRLPDIKVLFLTECEDHSHIFASMEAGAMGYIVKRVNRNELVRIIKSIYRGEMILSPFLANLTFNGKSHKRSNRIYQHVMGRLFEKTEVRARQVLNKKERDLLRSIVTEGV